MKNKTAENNSRREHSRWSPKLKGRSVKGIVPCSLAGFLLAAALCIILAFILSFILYQTADPAVYITPAAFSALYIASLMGGFAASRLNNGSALLCGLLVGTLIISLLFICSLFIAPEQSADLKALSHLALRAAVLACAVVGAFLGLIKNEKKTKRKTHKKR